MQCPLPFPFMNNGLSVAFSFQTKVHTDTPHNFQMRRYVMRISGQCGSCWAFGTGGSLADRLCIASNASKVRHTLPTRMQFLGIFFAA